MNQPIKWLQPGCSCRVPTHPDIDKLIAQTPDANGKNALHVRGEVLLAYRDAILNSGHFSVSSTRLSAMYNNRVRHAILTILGRLSTKTKGHIVGLSSQKKVLKPRYRQLQITNDFVDETHFDGAAENVQQYIESDGNILSNIPSLNLDPAWYQWRQDQWAKLALSQPDWNLNYCTGGSKVGNCVLSSLDDFTLPTSIRFDGLGQDKLDHATLWHRKLIWLGVQRHITRAFGRVYHPLLFSSKQIRRAGLLRGEPVAEIDLHATYHSLLISKMAPSKERDELIERLQTGAFYDAFDPIDDLKAEIQRQLLFARDMRIDQRPLMQQCQDRLPNYARYISCIRRRYGAAELAKSLMQRESEIWIERIMLDVFDNGRVPVIPLHDGLLLRESDAEAAQQVAAAILTDELGFTPLVNVKRSKQALPDIALV